MQFAAGVGCGRQPASITFSSATGGFFFTYCMLEIINQDAKPTVDYMLTKKVVDLLFFVVVVVADAVIVAVVEQWKQYKLCTTMEMRERQN